MTGLNRIRVEDARLQQLEVNYRNTVLRAHQEVEDSLVGFVRKQEEAGYLVDSVAAAQRSVDLSSIQYREGVVDYQRVLESQRSLASAQDLWTLTRGQVVLNLVSLYKSLGGGWQLRDSGKFVPAASIEEMKNRTDWGDLLEPEQLVPPSKEVKSLMWRRPDW